MIDQDDDLHAVQGVKSANIQVSMTYPIVSAWEFEFLKEEDVIRARLDQCSIYLLAQRPLTYFDNVVLQDHALFFEIADGVQQPLKCRVDLVDAGICEPGTPVDVETAWHIDGTGQEQPFREVAAIKLFKVDGTFILWWSPHKILYEMIVNGLRVETADGDPRSFLDFTVLYIGKSFDQKVWNRLTGHDQMQKIMTVQNPVGAAPWARAPFEVSLILLTVVGLTEAIELPFTGLTLPPDVKPILHELSDDEALGRFACEAFVPVGDEAMTREVEALLINCFQPKFNRVKFKKYPNIEGGMRSKGYSWTELEIENMPAALRTPNFSYAPLEDAVFEALGR